MSDYMKCIHTGLLESGDDFATQKEVNDLNWPPPAFLDWFDGFRCYFKRTSKTLELNRLAAYV